MDRRSTGLAAGDGIWSRNNRPGTARSGDPNRFLWALEKEAKALERALKAWVKDVLKVLGQGGGLKELGLLEISLDGKHLKVKGHRPPASAGT